MTFAKNDTDLAKLTKVSRRTIYKMRERGAPSGVCIEEWLRWLKRQPRTSKYVAALAKYLAQHGDPEIGISGALDGAPRTGGDETLDDLGPVGRVRYEREQLKLENERRVQAQLDRELLKQGEVVAAVRALGARTVAGFKNAVWLEQVPHLDGQAASLVKRLRTAHDMAVRKIRDRITRSINEALSALIEE